MNDERPQGVFSYRTAFKATLDKAKQQLEGLKERLRELTKGPSRPWERDDSPTKHPGSKKDKNLVKAKRRRQGKAAKQARKLNRTGKARPKGFR